MTAEATTPCVKCGSFAVQRKSDGLFCLVCATKRTGLSTRTVPVENMRPQGTPPVGGLEAIAPCPRCQSTAVQRKDGGSFCLVCGKARQGTGLLQQPVLTGTNFDTEDAVQATRPAPTQVQPVKQLVQDSTLFLEKQLNAKISRLIQGTCTFHAISADGTLVYRIYDSTDRDIESVVNDFWSHGKAVIGRSTWASRKMSDGKWEPVFLLCLGVPNERRPDIAVVVIRIADFFSSPRSHSVIASRVGALRPELSEAYVLPPVILWDGRSVSDSGNICGMSFRGAITSGRALRPIHLALDGAQTIGQPVQTASMAKDPVGAIRVTEFQPDIFRAPLGGGELHR